MDEVQLPASELDEQQPEFMDSAFESDTWTVDDKILQKLTGEVSGEQDATTGEAANAPEAAEGAFSVGGFKEDNQPRAFRQMATVVPTQQQGSNYAPEPSPYWAKGKLPPVPAAGKIPGALFFITVDNPASNTKYGIVAYDPFVTKDMDIKTVFAKYKGRSNQEFPLPYYEVFTPLKAGQNNSPQWISKSAASSPPSYYCGAYGNQMVGGDIAGGMSAPWYYANATGSPIKNGFTLAYWNNGIVKFGTVSVDQSGIFTGSLETRFSIQGQTQLIALKAGDSTVPVVEVKTLIGGSNAPLKFYVDYYAMVDGPLKTAGK